MGELAVVAAFGVRQVGRERVFKGFQEWVG
jgi:hypothetical protein